jgi:TonB-dependent receptor
MAATATSARGDDLKRLRRTATVLALLGAIAGGRAIARAQEQASAPLGTIAGQVIDASTGDPIIEAGVEVIGVAKTIRTDLDGRYSVKVPAGTYQVRFFAPLYQGARLEKVVVEPSKVAKADVPLKPQGQAGIDIVEVVAQAQKAAEATQLIKRQKAAVVSDNIGAETIAKSPDADAAEIVQRVPAVTIKDDKFIFVRGLGERYSNALLDGSRLPSPDPTRRVVPLDLFPSEFIDSISIVKTFTPDLPGDFSGGLADINLLDFPQQLTYAGGITTGGNSQTTFQDFNTYKGSKLDYFGFGGGYRKLPSIIPGMNLGGNPPAQLQAFGRSFKDIWETDTTTAPLDVDVNFHVGDRWGPLGAQLAVTYRTKYRTRHDQIERQFLQSENLDNPVPVLGDDFKFDRSKFETRLGSVFTAAYELSPDHHFTFRSLIDRNATDEVLIGRGQAEQTKVPSTSTELSYTQDELDFGQVGGTDHFHWLDLDWRSALSRTTENVPDQRFIAAADTDGDGRFTLTNDAKGGSRVFQDLTEYLTDSQVDFTVPFTTWLPFTDVWSGLPAKFKFGPAYLHRDRDASIRTFNFAISQSPGGPQIDLSGRPNDVFNPSNIGGNSPFPVRFQETTLPQDAFKASQEIGAGYGMIELPLVRDRLRLIAGVRTEYSYIKLHIVRPETRTSRSIIKENLDPLPGVNLVYSPRNDMNVRAAWSKTVSRPEFRELSPAVYPAPRGLRAQVGNPDLVETGVDSYDLRWEWFFSPSELVSVSGFYKTIAKPIETAVHISGSAPEDTFSQNKDAKLIGFEFEGRKNLGFFTPALRYVNFLTNVSWVHSEVTATLEQLGTTRKRPLQGQADYVVNAALEYANPDVGTVRLLYNTVGPTIRAVQDVTGLPDFVAGRRDQVDLVFLTKIHPWTVPLNLKLALENILNDRYPTTVGGVVQEDYRTGVTVSLGVSYNY